MFIIITKSLLFSLQVGFKRKVFVSKVDIYETYLPGSVVAVAAKNESGSYQTLWSTDSPNDNFHASGISRIFSPTLEVNIFIEYFYLFRELYD